MLFFGNKRLMVVLVGLVLLISVMGFTSKTRGALTWPEKFLKDTFSVVQGIFYGPAQAFSTFFEDVGDAYNVYEENRALKASLDQYAQVTAKLAVLEAENDELRKTLQAETSTLKQYHLRIAEVVARSSDYWNNAVTIDKGLKHGIKKDMAVVTAQGLIGRVQSVSNFSSTVELLTNIEGGNHIASVILGKQVVNGTTVYQQANGVIEEYDPRERMLIMRKIPLNQKIEVNQQVLTSGLGGVIPRGLPIGIVARVQPDDYGLTQTAYIQPSADFGNLNEVMVVERAFVTTPTGELIPSSQLDETGNVKSPAVGSQKTPGTKSSSGGGQ
ncbi:rod shape-determining protein MreC [Brevibacillus fluminis]|uniref:Cell shape-determining protein MreC n=1 Tax=Brevibacillus fluminis TaxID=511487 RepID=A0A3M8DR57_9BACL|nr:rod shape-determining protein MreC [Brevibacillus fluminis]RNB90572.1 rod shape-determining protein MreC [Brevibacillus fluminis]